MELIVASLTQPGALWLAASVVLAGLVRGFSGFGTAMVFLPVAGQFLTPVQALTCLIVMDFFGPLPFLRRGWRDADRADLARLVVPMALCLPLGLVLLTSIPEAAFRYAVSLISMVLLVLLISGFRYRGPMTRPILFGTGGLSGFLTGSVGLGGPPIIMLYLSSARPAAAIRANTLLAVFASDVVMLAALALGGFLFPQAVTTGILLVLPYGLGMVAGARLFRPEAERAYRLVAYGIIAISALSGLPLFD